LASPNAIALPMPLLPPVTSATLFSNDNCMVLPPVKIMIIVPAYFCGCSFDERRPFPCHT
jgi:hypothetical protein